MGEALFPDCSQGNGADLGELGNDLFCEIKGKRKYAQALFSSW